MKRYRIVQGSAYNGCFPITVCWDEGLSEDAFREFIDEYVYEKHYDDELDDIAKDWQLPYKELAIKILEELK